MDKKRVSVTGVVVAVSHLLLPPTAGFFMKIFNTKPLCIRVRLKEHFQWLTFIKVGVTYRFANVIPMELNSGTKEAVQFVDIGAKSMVEEFMLALPLSLQNISLSSISYEGTVTDDSLSSLGLYKLQEDFTLCTSFIAHRVCIESFECSDPIIVYNAHSINVCGKKYYIMCARSYAVSQPGNIPRHEGLSTLHPVIAYVLEKGLGFEDFLWLTTVYSKLKNLLDQKLILGNEIYRKHVFKTFNHLLFGNPTASDSSPMPRSLVKEFLLDDHKCPPFCDRKHPNLNVITAEDCHNWSNSNATTENFWSYNIFRMVDRGEVDVRYTFVGRLNIAENIPRLMLSDGVTTLCCVFIGDSGSCCNIKSYIDETVVVRKASVVVEQFRLEKAGNGVSFEKNYVYLFLSPRDMYLLCPSSENITESSHSRESSKSSDLRKSHSAVEQNAQAGLLSQHLVIHHVSTPIIFENEKQFFCLVSLLGQPVGSSNSVVEKFNQRGRLCLLCMKKNMLRYHPFLFENRVYEIKYPRSCGMHLFDKRTNFSALASGAVFLPCTEGVIIPNNCSIEGPFTSPNLPSDSIMDAEIYRVSDAESVGINDVVHLQGVLVFRSHQQSKYPRKRKIQDDNYGIPVEQNIIVELRDEDCDKTIRIYLIAYASKLYPLGLLPGSRVRLKFVEKKISGRNKHFYQSTCFTSIQILEHLKGRQVSESSISLDSSKRHSFIAKEVDGSCNLQSPFWGIFSISKIWKFQVLSCCRSCNSLIRYGKCTYVGCSNILKDPLIKANANFLVEDGSGEAYMSAKDENVRMLLGFSESEWKDLGAVAMQNEVLFDNRKSSSQSGQQSDKMNQEDMNQVVFNGLCSQVELKPWHILCRKFMNDGGDILRLFCLDVQEIDLTRAESLSFDKR